MQTNIHTAAHLITATGRNKLPYGWDPHFVDREEVIDEIKKRFQIRRCVALAGIGGVG